MSGSIWRMVKPSAVDVDGPRELFSEPEFGRGTFEGGGESTYPGCGAPVPRSQRAQPAVVQWRPERIPKLKHPRQPGRGLFFGAADSGDAGVFCIEGSSAVLCTGAFRDFVERRGCTNVAFMEAGELIA